MGLLWKPLKTKIIKTQRPKVCNILLQGAEKPFIKALNNLVRDLNSCEIHFIKFHSHGTSHHDTLKDFIKTHAVDTIVTCKSVYVTKKNNDIPLQSQEQNEQPYFEYDTWLAFETKINLVQVRFFYCIENSPLVVQEKHMKDMLENKNQDTNLVLKPNGSLPVTHCKVSIIKSYGELCTKKDACVTSQAIIADTHTHYTYVRDYDVQLAKLVFEALKNEIAW